MNKELIRLAKKAANAWYGTDTYHQAAEIIMMLIDELEKVDKERVEAINDMLYICESPNPFGCIMMIEKWEDKVEHMEV